MPILPTQDDDDFSSTDSAQYRQNAFDISDVDQVSVSSLTI